MRKGLPRPVPPPPRRAALSHATPPDGLPASRAPAHSRRPHAALSLQQCCRLRLSASSGLCFVLSRGLLVHGTPIRVPHMRPPATSRSGSSGEVLGATPPVGVEEHSDAQQYLTCSDISRVQAFKAEVEKAERQRLKRRRSERGEAPVLSGAIVRKE